MLGGQRPRAAEQTRVGPLPPPGPGRAAARAGLSRGRGLRCVRVGDARPAAPRGGGAALPLPSRRPPVPPGLPRIGARRARRRRGRCRGRCGACAPPRGAGGAGPGARFPAAAGGPRPPVIYPLPPPAAPALAAAARREPR